MMVNELQTAIKVYLEKALRDKYKNTILVHSGTISENEGKPKPAILE
jgi:hypothetical protein